MPNQKIKLNSRGKRLNWTTILFLIGGAAALRLLPHPPNFAPISALALFGGTYLQKRYSLAIPLLAMFISDLFLGFYSWKLMISVYLSFLMIGFLGLWLKKYKKLLTVIGCSILASILFFLITNFAVWAFTPWYAKTLSGLIHCYVMALPFFKNTLLGDFFYVSLMFGIYEVVHLWLARRYRVSSLIT